MLTSNKDKNKRYSIPFFRLIFTGETHGIFIEENEESVASSESDADSVSRKSSMESVMSDCSMTDVTRQVPFIYYVIIFRVGGVSK